MKASEHVRGRDTEDKVLFCVPLFRGLVDKALHSLLDLIVRLHEVSWQGENWTDPAYAVRLEKKTISSNQTRLPQV